MGKLLKCNVIILFIFTLLFMEYLLWRGTQNYHLKILPVPYRMSIDKPQDSDDNMPIRVRPLKKSIRKIQNNGYHIPNPIKSFINSTDRRIMNSRHNYRLGNDLFVFAALYGTARKNRITPSFKSKIDLGKIFEIPILPDPAVPAKEKVKDFHERSYGVYDLRTEAFAGNYSSSISMTGYYQSWKYFKGYESEIRSMLRLKPDAEKKAKTHLNKILPVKFKNDSYVRVGIHVRRGDLTGKGLIRRGYRMAPKEFYHHGMEYFKNIYPNVVFIVCSDDIKHAKTIIKADNVYFSSATDAVLDFTTLAIMDHIIMSVGTFGWWAAWIVNGKTVYYKFPFEPLSALARNFKHEDYYPPHWIPME